MHSPMLLGSRQIFYGWYVVYAIGFVMTAVSGLVFYNLPVLLDAFVRERGFPVALASNATSLFFLSSGLAGLVVGQFVDRIDPRYIMVGGATVCSLALLATGSLYEPWQLFVLYVVFGLSFGACGLVPTTTILTRWFEDGRSLALSIASTGLSLGGVIFTPISVLLILHLGLAGAAPWIALALFFGIVPVTLLIVRASPAAKGLQPYRISSLREPSSGAPLAHVSFARAVKSRFFIATGCTFLLVLGAQIGGIAHIFRLANTRVDPETATIAVSVLAVSSILGRLVVGWLLIRSSARGMTLILIAVQSFGLAMLAFASGSLSILIASAVFGLCAGSALMMQPLLLAEAFGVGDYGRIYSLGQLVGVFGYVIGPSLIGILYQTTGGYMIPYLAIAAGSLAGMGTLALSGPTRQTPS